MDNDGITDTTGNTVSWAWFNGGYKTVKLTINGSKNTTMVIHVLPRLGTPYAVSDGGNFETNPGILAAEPSPEALTCGNGERLRMH